MLVTFEALFIFVSNLRIGKSELQSENFARKMTSESF